MYRNDIRLWCNHLGVCEDAYAMRLQCNQYWLTTAATTQLHKRFTSSLPDHFQWSPSLGLLSTKCENQTDRDNNGTFLVRPSCHSRRCCKLSSSQQHTEIQGGSKKRGHCFTACNFRSIDQNGTKFGTLFVTLPRNLFESTLENKVAPPIEWQ